MSNATAAKIPASTIVIKRAEGPYDLCVARVFSTDETALSETDAGRAYLGTIAALQVWICR